MTPELQRIDSGPIDVAGRVPAFVVVRDERVRLPAMLAHHRRLGVGPFFVVDNGSQDGSVEFLLEQQDVHVWTASGSFAAARCGTDWQLELIDEHGGGGGWCLVIDADELFVYAGFESGNAPIGELCRQLDSIGADALLAVSIDVYGKRPIAETTYAAGADPLAACGWFDRTTWTSTRDDFAGHRAHPSYFGGVRQRVFGSPDGADAETYYTLNKVPLFRGGREREPSPNFHWMDRACFSPARAALLHWKYTAGFETSAGREVERAEHWNGASQYKRYRERLAAEPALTLYDPAESVRFLDSAQLADLGILVPVPAAVPVSAPGDPHLRGMAEAARGDYEAAISSFREAISATPDVPWSYGALADVLTKCGSPTEAAEAYRSALIHTARDAVPLREAIAVGLSRAGDQGAAIDAFRCVLAEEPGRATSAIGLARALLALSDQMRREAAQILVATDDVEGDEELLSAAIDAAPREPGLYRRLAQSLARRGDRSRALVAIQLGLAHDPDDPAALALFAELLAADEGRGDDLTAEQRDRVLDLVERAVIADPEDTMLLVRRARLLARHGSQAQATDAWRRVVEREPEVALWHRELGDRLAAMGDFAAAGEEYDRAVRLGYDIF